MQLGGLSSSAVYLITAPSSNGTIQAKTKTLAFKVVHDNDKFSHETEVLEIIRDQWRKSGRSDFYYLGFFNGKSNELNRPIKYFSECKDKYAVYNGPDWLRGVPIDISTDGGVIIMEPSDRQTVLDTGVDKAEAFSQLLACLLLLVTCGVLHLDLRPPNLLHFPTGWQVVDFDHAVLNDGEKKTYIHPKSGQAWSAGYSLKKEIDKASQIRREGVECLVNVSMRDDIEMLFAAIMSRAP